MIALLIPCFSSCKFFDELTWDRIVNSKDYYKVTLEGESYEMFMSDPLKSHYKVGETVKVDVPSFTDFALRVFVNGVEVPRSQWESNDGYYEFVMPAEDVTIFFTSDEYYGRDVYSFVELCYWIPYVSGKLTKITVKTTNDEVKDSFVENRYFTNPEAILSFDEILQDHVMIKADNSLARAEKQRSEINFFYDDESSDRDQRFSMKFYGEYFIRQSFSSSQAFRFENFSMPSMDNPDSITYSFKRYTGINYIRKYGDESIEIAYDHSELVEFVPYDGPLTGQDATYYLEDREYGIINLISATVFELNGRYYEIVSGEKQWAYNKK